MYRFSYTLIALLFSVQAAFAQVGFNETVLNPNLAESDELEALPHFSDTLADAVIGGAPTCQ